jgi:hypothetical protein
MLGWLVAESSVSTNAVLFPQALVHFASLFGNCDRHHTNMYYVPRNACGNTPLKISSQLMIGRRIPLVTRNLLQKQKYQLSQL